MPNEDRVEIQILEEDHYQLKGKCLYRPERFDLVGHPRCLWPSYDMPARISKLAASIDSPVWVEIGLGPHSPLYNVPARRVMFFDTRPWVSKLMSDSHDPLVWNSIAEISSQHNAKDEYSLLQIRKKTRDLNSPLSQAMAFYLIAAVGGRTLSFRAFDASLAIGGMTGHPAVIRRSRHFIATTLVCDNVQSAMWAAVRGTRNSAKFVHIHINEILPLDDTINILLSLRNIGFSWSMSIYDPRLVHDAKKVADVFDWNGIPFAWCPRHG